GRERGLKRIGICGQRILDDGFHLPLAERAARLLVREDAGEARDLIGERADILLRGVDDGEARFQLAELVRRGLRAGYMIFADALCEAVEPLGHGLGEFRLLVGQNLTDALKPPEELHLGTKKGVDLLL